MAWYDDLDFNLGGAPSVDMSWLNQPDYANYNLGLSDDFYNFDIGDYGSWNWDFDFPNFDFGPTPDFNFNWDFPTFDPGQFNLGFDPQFNLGDPFALPTGDLNLPTLPLTSALGDPGFGSSAAPFDQEATWRQMAQGMSAAGTNIMSGANPAFQFETGFDDLDLDRGANAPALMGLTSQLGTGASTDWYNPSGEPTFGLGGGGAAPAPGLNLPPGVPLPEMGPEGSYWSGGVDQSKTTGATTLANLAKGDKTGTQQNNESRDFYYRMAPWLGLGQLGLGLGGGLMQSFFQPEPKARPLNDIEKAKIQADIDAQKAKLDLEREALALQREQMGMEGSEEGMLEARLAAEKEMNEARLANALEVARIQEREPLFGTDPRFSTLYDETVGAQGQITPDSPMVKNMTDQIFQVRMGAVQGEFAKQRAAIIERANRLGTNPAAELAQINEAEQKATMSLFSEAQQVALAFAQDRLKPSFTLLQQIMGTVV